MERGTGATTRQIKEAPKGAIFVWCNSHVDYARHLAHFLGRGDLQIVSPETFERIAPVIRFNGIVVDHAVRLSSRAECLIREIEEARR